MNRPQTVAETLGHVAVIVANRDRLSPSEAAAKVRAMPFTDMLELAGHITITNQPTNRNGHTP